MNIKFYNLGKIKETELELKPLTVIIGPNNTNKTYLAYSIYGVWQSMGAGSIRFSRSQASSYMDLDGTFSIPIEDLHKNFTADINRSITRFESDLNIFFQDSSQALFSQTHYEVKFSKPEFDLELFALVDKTFSFYGNQYVISVENNILRIKLTGDQGPRSLPLEVLAPELLRSLFALLRQQMISRPYLMPAERNAFVITYKVLANRRLKLMLDAQRRLFSTHRQSKETEKRQIDLLREAGEVRYPQPIEDFLELLFEIENNLKSVPIEDEEALLVPSSALRPTKRRSKSSVLGRLAGEIEQNIQDGNTINFRPTALGGQEIMVDLGNGLSIDLYNASSSIKQLAPLLLYLRHRAARNDLLIIDEPEMNLHPESQAKLLEVLAILVNQGVNVLLTTHSPYLMAHLNNLAQTEELTAANKRKSAKALYLNNPSAILQMSKISAYEMRDGKLHSLKDPDYGIRWNTLSDISSDLQQKYFATHE